MKKNHFLPAALAAVCALSLSSCRDYGDSALQPESMAGWSYESYVQLYEVLWNNVNSSYIFWDVDTVDWDARYEECLPLFQALDTRRTAGDTVTLAEYGQVCKQLFAGLTDHHMSIKLRNPFPAPGEENMAFIINIGIDEVMRREGYHASVDASLSAVLDSLQARGRVSSLDTASVPGLDFHCAACLLDDTIAYLRFNEFAFTEVRHAASGTSQARAWQVLQSWKKLIADRASAALIDCRSNGGGYCDDLSLILSPFLEKDLSLGRYRSKQGMGRLDYSPWCPLVCPAGADSVKAMPVAVLCDMMSVSMAEICTYAVRQLPSGCAVGERTFGATGPLEQDLFDRTYGGPYGNIQTDFYEVYTSTYEWHTPKGCLEGVGVTPDLEVKTDPQQLLLGIDDQMEMALMYLRADTTIVR